MIRHLVLGCLVALLPSLVAAQIVTLPDGAQQVSNRVSPLDSYALPVAPFDGQSVPTQQFEGRVERDTWRLSGTALTTLQLLDPLRDQIARAGYEIVFQCQDRECGGFDFRFQTEVVPAPDMQVDIRNYRFVSAVRGSDRAISLLVSRSRTAAYVQVITVAPGEDVATAIPPGGQPGTGSGIVDANDPIRELTERGHVVLGDLDFATGADALGPGPYRSLQRLASHLRENPDLRIAVVGHTDSSGALQDNIALSKRRAAAVRTRLIEEHGVSAARVEAEGMGYLAPVASNLTAQGREANRRVEAILLPGG
ncbi:OmpA family protein [Rhodobacteraceae bacterium F11138]|nr:OmpA family protein [Rhodobacteraceae bacterium F11138]